MRTKAYIDSHFRKINPIMIFPTVSDVSGYNILFALQSTAAVLIIQPSVETLLPAVMEASLQPSIFQQNYLGHQQFAFSSYFSLMFGDKSRFQLQGGLKSEYLHFLLLILLMQLELDLLLILL